MQISLLLSQTPITHKMFINLNAHTFDHLALFHINRINTSDSLCWMLDPNRRIDMRQTYKCFYIKEEPDIFNFFGCVRNLGTVQIVSSDMAVSIITSASSKRSLMRQQWAKRNRLQRGFFLIWFSWRTLQWSEMRSNAKPCQKDLFKKSQNDQCLFRGFMSPSKRCYRHDYFQLQ